MLDQPLVEVDFPQRMQKEGRQCLFSRASKHARTKKRSDGSAVLNRPILYICIYIEYIHIYIHTYIHILIQILNDGELVRRCLILAAAAAAPPPPAAAAAAPATAAAAAAAAAGFDM